ncbi:MAG: hypothetical protein AVDCRST_MAG11-852, partial [uncultured Gemmatimonadaceae bacterium]
AAAQREAQPQRGRVLPEVRRRAAEGAARGARRRARGARPGAARDGLPRRRRGVRRARDPPRQDRHLHRVRGRVAGQGRARAAHRGRPPRLPRRPVQPRV